MQNIEKIFGLRIYLEDKLEPYRLESLKKRVGQLAVRFDLNPEEHYVYFHSLVILPNLEHFSKGTSLHDKVHSVRIDFLINPKQRKSGAIRFFNHLFHGVLESDVDPYATSTMISYTVGASYIEQKGTFKNELITFVSKSLRKDYRKIKISVSMRPTELYKQQLVHAKSAITRLDLHYERYTPLELPKSVRFATGAGHGPKLVWRGPRTQRELHSFLHEDLPVDVGEMSRMLERSLSVCRIEIPEGYPYGTGGLIQPDLVITNFHVLDLAIGHRGDDLFGVAQQVIVRFGAVTDEMGKELPGELFRLDTKSPIIERSHTDDLDFVLLQLERSVENGKFTPAPFDLTLPEQRQTLSILQYPILDPANNPLKMTTSPNGITGVYHEVGRVQYVTRASRGASGAPCFSTPHWKLIAIHHSEEAVAFGKRREGILFASIFKKIEKHLKRGANAESYRK
jgi:V8-like Glu-specific endopeptidase